MPQSLHFPYLHLNAGKVENLLHLLVGKHDGVKHSHLWVQLARRLWNHFFFLLSFIFLGASRAACGSYTQMVMHLLGFCIYKNGVSEFVFLIEYMLCGMFLGVVPSSGKKQFSINLMLLREGTSPLHTGHSLTGSLTI